jgi:tripartite-type tricarboxylate transporter receptor subunit TctC
MMSWRTIVAASAKPHVRGGRLRALAVSGPERSPEEFDAFVRAELAKYAQVIKQAGIKLD